MKQQQLQKILKQFNIQYDGELIGTLLPLINQEGPNSEQLISAIKQIYPVKYKVVLNVINSHLGTERKQKNQNDKNDNDKKDINKKEEQSQQNTKRNNKFKGININMKQTSSKNNSNHQQKEQINQPSEIVEKMANPTVQKNKEIIIHPLNRKQRIETKEDIKLENKQRDFPKIKQTQQNQFKIKEKLELTKPKFSLYTKQIDQINKKQNIFYIQNEEQFYNQNYYKWDLIIIYISEYESKELTAGRNNCTKDKYTSKIQKFQGNYVSTFVLNLNQQEINSFQFRAKLKTQIYAKDRTDLFDLKKNLHMHRGKAICLINTLKEVNKVQTIKIQNFTLFNTLNLMVKGDVVNRTRNLSQMFCWLKVMMDLYQKMSPNQEQKVFEQANKLIEGVQMSEWIIYFLFGIYRDKTSYKIQTYKLIKKMELKSGYMFIKWQKSQYFTEMQYLYMKQLLYNKIARSSTLPHLEIIFKSIIKNLPPLDIKQILIKTSKEQPKLLARCHDIVDNLLVNSQVLTLQDWFLIKTHYLSNVFQHLISTTRIGQTQVQDSVIINGFFNELTKKYSTCSQSQKNLPKQIKYSKDGLRQIFLKSGWASTNLRISQKKFILMYQHMKELFSTIPQIAQIVASVLMLKIQSNYEGYMKKYGHQMMSVMLTNPTLKKEYEQMKQYFLNQPFDNKQMFELMNLYSKELPNFNYNILLQLLESFLQRGKKYKFELFSTFQFINQITINQTPSKARIINLFNLIIQHTKLQLNESLNKHIRLTFQLKDPTLRLSVGKLLCNEIKRQIRHEQQFYNIINRAIISDQEKRDYFISIYFENDAQQNQETYNKIWNCFTKNIEYIGYIRSRFRINFDFTVQKIKIKISESKLLWEQLDGLQNNKNKLLIYTNRKFIQQIQKCRNKRQDYFKKLKNIIDILYKCQSMCQIASYFSRKEGELKTKLLQNAYLPQIGQDEVWLFQNCLQMKSLMGLQISIIHTLPTLEEIKKQYIRLKEQILMQIQNFKAAKMNMNDLQRYFPKHLVQNLTAIFCKQIQIKNKLINSSFKLNPQNLNKLQEFADSYCYLLKIISKQPQTLVYNNFKQLMNKIKADDPNLQAISTLKTVEQLEKQLSQVYDIKIDIRNPNYFLQTLQNNEISHIMKSTHRAQTLFQLIQSKNIDQKCIGDLKEYINDLQNSVLRMDAIKELENILEYWALIKNSITVYQFIKNLQKKIQKNQGQLWQQIDNAGSLVQLFNQKLEEAANRQTSFKYQIQAIFQDSTLMIKPFKDRVDIEAVASAKNIDKNQAKNNQLKVNYKRLELFKDKSILLISDIERQQNQDASLKHTLELFKTYEKYFSLVQKIQGVSKQLTNYGYNTLYIVGSVKVQKSDFTALQDKKQQLQLIASNWIEGIKKLSQQSYLLTHYIGGQLNQFINRCLNHQYHPSLKAILNLTKQKFEEKIKNQLFKAIIQQAKFQEPLKQIMLIIKAYSQFQQQSKHINNEISPIIIQICQEKYFYCCLLESTGKVASPTRVLYCLQQTKGQQIQIFLWRAIIDNQKNYYFVGAHNLKQETRLFFCDVLMNLLQNQQQKLQRTHLYFIDSVMTDKLYSFLTRSKMFNFFKKQENQAQLQSKTEKMISSFSPTWVVTSKKAGLGKTHKIEQMSKLQNKFVKFFPLAGHTDFKKLGKRLKEEYIIGGDSLCISVGEVQNWHKVEVFLSELILFRCFYCEEYIFLPQQLWIFIEVQNIYRSEQEQIYPILALLNKCKQNIHIQNFDVTEIDLNFISDEDKFVLIYLQILSQPGQINNKQFYFVQVAIEPDPAQPHALIQNYFCDWFIKRNQQPTFLIYKAFMKMLFNSFRAFSECVYLKIEHVMVAGAQFQKLQFHKFRQSFLQICIQNVLQFLAQTFTSNDFSSIYEYSTFCHKMNDMNMLILPSVTTGNYNFVYASDDKIPLCIKSILLTQNYYYFNKIGRLNNISQLHAIFAETALNKLPDKELQIRLKEMIISISEQNLDYLPEELKMQFLPNFCQYKLTLDNFIKMCLIWHRAKSGIPCIIMGQSGVGKTKLISFFVRQILKNDLMIFNLHAGIHEEQLAEWVQRLTLTAEGWGEHNKVWAFFDEFNTCDELSYIKEMVIDHRFMGKPLPSNIIMIAACNPYRKRRHGNLNQAGIGRNQNQENELAFKVKAPSLSMIQLMWDYQQLKQKQNRIYVQKMLQKLAYKKTKELVNTIVYTHQYLKKNIQISSVSLRDITRFKKVYDWFIKYMPKGQANKKKNANPNYFMNRQERAAILTFSFCYCLRLSSEQQRQHLYVTLQKNLNLPKGYARQVVVNEQIDYVKQLKAPDQLIAFNRALIENVFACLICLLNKIPVLLIGNPGSSKSLSMRLIQSNMRGKGSASQFCRQFPQLNVLYFQGSESSTSKGVEQIFEKAMRWRMESNKKWQIEQVILFDQIGLAQKSVHNPLKVLHSKLEDASEQVCFIGISNWELDLAKMSRFLVIERSTPKTNDLEETAFEIAKSYLQTQTQTYEDYLIEQKQWRKLGQHYHQFISKWQKRRNQQNFFGLRDFYGYVKFVCSKVKSGKGKLGVFEKAIEQSIHINFDGQIQSVNLFREVAKLNPTLRIDPVQLIKQNLARSQSRCLLMIVKGDSLVPLINRDIKFDSPDKKIICIHGSTFELDQESQQYNLQMTSLIIAHISRGNVLAFKDINNSIQTSLYDLFNKSFTRVGLKRYCRIAVGANSNPKCLVHHNFNAIVYVEQNRLQHLDPPFLNRFQKHYLNIKTMMSKIQLAELEQIKKWIDDLLQYKQKQSLLKNQQYLMNTSEQSLITLIIKYRESQNKMVEIKRQILNNRTTDFTIAIENNIQLFRQNQMEELIESKNNIIKNKQDLIIYTYDQFLGLTEYSILNKGYFIHFQEVQSQKQLRRQLKLGLQSNFDNIQVFVNFQNHRQHLSFLLFLAVELKTSMGIDKQIVIIIQMHRFSLQHLKIDHLNISYLHPFRQMFLQSLNYKVLEQIQQILLVKTYWQAYVILQMKKQFVSHFTDTLKFTKFVEFKSKKPHRQGLYFNECLQLGSNPIFEQMNQISLKTKLSVWQINLKIIQTSNDDIGSASTVLQAICKHVQNKVKQIIFQHMKAIVSHNLLFHLTKQEVDITGKLSAKFKEIVNSNKRQIANMVQKEVNQQTDSINIKTHFNFRKRLEENVISTRQQIFLLPISWHDIDIIFIQGGEQTIEKKANNINLKRTDQENQDYLIADCHQLYNTKSRINQYQLTNVFKQKRGLQALYFYDIITHLLLITDRSTEFAQQITTLFLNIFKQYPLIDKLIFLTADRTLSLILLDLLSEVANNQMLSNAILYKIQFVLVNQIGPSLMVLLQQIINQIIIKLIPEKTAMVQFRSLKQFIIKQGKLHQIINNAYASFQQYGIYLLQQFQVNHKFIELLGNFDNQLSLSLLQKLDAYRIQSPESSLCFTIFKTLQELSSGKCQKTQTVVLSYLSYNIFYMWIVQTKQKYHKQLKHCLHHFVQLANIHSIFANHSAPFLQELLTLPSFSTIIQFFQYFKKIKIDEFEQVLSFNNNISVALGFYLFKLLNQVLQKEIKQKVQDLEMSSFVTNQYRQFFQYLVRNNQQNSSTGMQNLLKIQFTKIYCLCYLHQLDKKRQNSQMLQKIDNILSQDNLLTNHLRLFLLKHLLQKYGSLLKIRREYIQIQRCKWILTLSQLIQQQKTELLLPSTQTNQILQFLITQFVNGNYSDKDIFHQIILQGIREPVGTHIILTFFLCHFYMRNCPQQYIKFLISEVQGRDDLKQPQHKLIKTLILMYLNHNVNKLIKYSMGSKVEEVQYYLPLLNYLNVMVSCRKNITPLIQIFFNQNGIVPDNYHEWLNDKYLIGTVSNPCLQRANYILKRQSQGFSSKSYIICSENCSYLTPVGGYFYGNQQHEGCGIVEVGTVIKCSLCGKVSKITDKNDKVLDKKAIQIERQFIFKRNSFVYQKQDAITQIILTGYQNGNKIQKIRQNLYLKQHFFKLVTQYLEPNSHFVSYKMGQTIINMLWHLLILANCINQQQTQKIFNLKKDEASAFTLQASMQYFKSVNQSIVFANDQQMIIWHYAFAKQLFNHLNQANQHSLIQLKVKQDEEEWVQNKVISMTGVEKEQVIKLNRKVQIINRSQIVREVGNIASHQEEYPFIRMFKLIRIEVSPSIENMQLHFRQIISRQYPLLAFLLNTTIQQKLTHYFNIFKFITRLTALNMKLSRSDSNQSIQTIVDQYFKSNQQEHQNANLEMISCIQSWNHLVSHKYLLKDGCRELGYLQKINNKSPVRFLIIQKNHQHNLEGKKAVQFLATASSEYNQICKILQNLGSKSNLHFMSELKMNPTIFKPQTYLTLPFQAITSAIKIYASYSVEYGISNPHYLFEHIQLEAVKQINGCKYLIDDKSLFQFTNFIGEDSSFMLFIRQEGQVSLQTSDTQKLKQYFKKKQNRQGQTFYKFVKELLGSLQSTIVCYKNRKNSKATKIGDFVKEFKFQSKMRNFSKQLTEDPFQSLSISCLGSLYQLIQCYTFDFLADLLNPIFNELLTEAQTQRFTKLFELMKTQVKRSEGFPQINVFKQVLLRYISRCLLLIIGNDRDFLASYLCELYWLWPKGFQLQQLNQQLKEQLRLTTISKTGELLKLIIKIQKEIIRREDPIPAFIPKKNQEKKISKNPPPVLNRKKIDRF